jgi:competence protein ComEC
VAAVLERFPTDLVLEPGELVTDRLYLDFLDEVAAERIPWKAGRPGDRFDLDSVSFTLLHPDTAWAEWGQDLNEDSIVLLIRYRGFEALFPGDAGLRAESLLAGRVGRVDLLKVGHHGSRSATGDRWLDELRPRVAVISSGAGNRYGHPSPEALDRLAGHGVSVWRTDREGEVTVTTDGWTLTVRGRRGGEAYSTH